MKRLLAAMAVCAVSAPAAADPLWSIAPPAYDWTGVYFGGQVGWAFAHSTTTTTDSLTGAYIGSGASDGTSFHGGGQIGYDFMTTPGFVLGARASLLWGSSKSTTNTNAAGTSVWTTSDSGAMSGSVDGRLGYAFGDWLPYATGGWAWADGTATRTQDVGFTGLATPGTVEQENVFRNGWNLGAGLEYRFWENFSVFGEYRYTQFGAVSVTFPLAQKTDVTSTSANAVNLGVNYKF